MFIAILAGSTIGLVLAIGLWVVMSSTQPQPICGQGSDVTATAGHTHGCIRDRKHPMPHVCRCRATWTDEQPADPEETE